MLLNPMTGIIDGFRSVLLNRPLDLTALASATAVSVAMLLAGIYYFRRTERRFADIA
jgi:lipopolysaccharide transport system permease protein